MSDGLIWSTSPSKGIVNVSLVQENGVGLPFMGQNHQKNNILRMNCSYASKHNNFDRRRSREEPKEEPTEDPREKQNDMSHLEKAELLFRLFIHLVFISTDNNKKDDAPITISQENHASALSGMNELRSVFLSSHSQQNRCLGRGQYINTMAFRIYGARARR